MLIGSRQKGVSLIEMMIGLTILGMLLAISFPGYMTWIQNTQIRTATESVLNGLQLARAEAVRRNTQVSFTLTGNDWSVDVVSPARNIQSRNGNDGSKNVVVASNQNAITFNGLGRISPVPATNITFSVTNPAGGVCQVTSGIMRCLSVSVMTSGQVRMCDPALTLSAPTNPQSC
jgi:type IV fimbrial biogenesis protein FimT